jgi:hypothetical protein
MHTFILTATAVLALALVAGTPSAKAASKPFDGTVVAADFTYKEKRAVP